MKLLMDGILTLLIARIMMIFLQRHRDYLDFISRQSGIKIDIVSVGPKRKQTFYVE